MTRNDIIKELDFGAGYVTSTLDQNDFAVLMQLVESQFKENLKKYYPNIFNDGHVSMRDYHILEINNHKQIWSKERRTIDEDKLNCIRELNLIKFLRKEFSEFEITNEDGTRSEEVYWRLVRPNESNDVGPLHADSWFWDLHNGPVKDGFRRIKVWISLYNECGVNGFRLIEGSQKSKYPYKGELRDGKTKPVHDNRLELDPSLRIIPTSPGDWILFHDDLIHGGAMGGNKTRISIEFTFLTKTI